MFVRKAIWFVAFMLLLMLCFLTGCHGEAHSTSDHATRIEDSSDRQIDPVRMQQLKQLAEKADKMVHEVMNGNILQAKDYMNQISDDVLQIEYDGITSVEGIEALTAVIVNAKQLMNAVQTETDRLKIVAMQVRLVTDALISKNQPLWHEYEKMIRQDTEELERAIEQGQHVLATAQRLQQRYTIIRPAVIVSRPPEVNVKVESLLSFFLQQANRPPAKLIAPLHELSRSWDMLFQSGDVSAYLPIIEGQHPIYWSLVIGSIIITVLCFVAWRKYQADLGIVTIGAWRGPRKDDR